MIRALGALLGAAAIALAAGCGTEVAEPASAAAPATAVAVAASVPVELTIDSIDARSSMIPLGLNPDGTVEVPALDTPEQAGWYSYGPTPGERGPAVILGHVNGNGEQGVFARLGEMRAGDEIAIRRADGSTAVFTAQRVEQVPKSQFPTDEVYGDTDTPQLRLITCGGRLDQERHSYSDNVIVYASLDEVG